MKKKTNQILNQLSFVSTMIALVIVALMHGCKGGANDGPSAEEEQLKKLTKTWTTESVTFGGNEDRTTDWSQFTLTVSGAKTYSTTGAFSPGPWPTSGTWDFAKSGDAVNINKVVRDDGLEVAITVMETSLTMTFIYNDADHKGGRTEAVNGEYVFKMK